MKYGKIILTFLGVLFFASAESALLAQGVTLQKYPLIGTVYEFDTDDSAYEVDAAESAPEGKPALPLGRTDKIKTIGQLFLQGNVTKWKKNEKDILSFELVNESPLMLTYKYDSSLAKASETDYHLSNDRSSTVNHLELENKIGRGAFILQTSPDGEHWTVVTEATDLTQSVLLGSSDGDMLNKIQLINGWYYRIWVAFQVEKAEKTGSWWNKIRSGTSYKKYLVVYEFKAGYKQPTDEFSPKKYCYGKDHTRKAKDNTYGEFEPMENGDFQYGWELGDFCLSGFAGKDEDVYERERKRVKLSFELKQDITRLNGQADLSVTRDKNGSDRKFETLPHDMKHGELLVKHKNALGQIQPVIHYTDFLAALAYPNAQTTIDFVEEGEYEVHLNYALKRKSFNPIGNTQYYQLSFSFKIVNGNCMPFIRENQTLNELEGDVVLAPSGFQISTGGAHFVKLEAQWYALYQDKNRLETNIKRHWTIGNGNKITDEGLYIITASCRNNKKTVKTVLVGKSKEINAYKRYFTIDRLHTLAEINKQLQKGYYAIADDGEIRLLWK